MANDDDRQKLLDFYANQGHGVPPLPHAVRVENTGFGTQNTMGGIRVFMEAFVRAGSTPFQTNEIQEAYQNSSREQVRGVVWYGGQW